MSSLLQQSQLKRFGMIFQTFVDRTTPYTLQRWITAVLLISLFLLRIFLLHSHYLVTYALGIYLLNLFLGFLTPKWLPSTINTTNEIMDGEDSDEKSPLPQNSRDEFQPFVRKLPEFKFWKATMYSTLLALLSTLFEFVDIPVYWPILVVYFLILVVLTMRKQIRHMIKYNYVPFDFFTKGRKMSVK